MSSKVFERYDIRGKYPEEIDEEFAEKIGRSYAKLILEEGKDSAVVTRDTKESSQSLMNSLIRGIKGSGLKVLDAGVGPTDYTAFSGMKHNCFSVQVTSSHLPQDFTGFKFMYPAGNSLVNKDLDRIRMNYSEENFEQGNGKVDDIEEESKNAYIDAAIAFLEAHELTPRKTVYLETLGGSGGLLLPEILENYSIKCRVSDEQRNPPNPEKHDLTDLETAVDSGEYDLGVAMDMDADRAMIYSSGEWIDGDQLFALMTKVFDSEKVVGSIDTSMAVREAFNGGFIETRVGDPFVLSKMVDEEINLSGEPNYHYAFNDFVPYNSGTMTALVAVSIDIESLLDEILRVTTLKQSVVVNDKEKTMQNIIDVLKSENRVESLKDGIKYRAGSASVLIRASGTSDKLRITIHSKNKDDADDAMEEALELIN